MSETPAARREPGPSEAPGTAEAAVSAALVRAAVYRLLAGAFLVPTPARLEGLAAGARDAAESLDGPLAEAVRRLAEATAAADPSATAAEHGFLFGRQVRCSPYESAYSGLSPFGDKSARLADVAGFYSAFGLGPAAAAPEMEDHIGAELEFMSALALKEAWALAEGDAEALAVTRDAERAFLGEHLGRWAGAFAAEVEAATPLPNLTVAAALLAFWIDAEVEALGATPTRATGPDDVDPEDAAPFACPLAPEDPTEE
jgi:TorA maturation chaperone TorD